MISPIQPGRPTRQFWLTYLVLGVAILYLAWLVSSAQTGVFFSSDGGIKYMAVKQFAAGHGFKYLYLPQSQWVQNIWAEGYFPLRPPFVYPSPQGYLFVFPPAFQVASSFFYGWLGSAGLYVIPVASTVLLWIAFILVLRRCAIPDPYIAMALFVLAFCSPLTIYGATYWEHMPAILLLFVGLSFILVTPSRPPVALLMGLLSGLAAWLRPEALAMNGLYAAAVLYLLQRDRRSPFLAFLAGMAISVGGFLLFNWIELGSILGIHSYQVLHQGDPGRTASPVENLLTNDKRALKYFCFILFLLPLAYALLFKRRNPGLRITLLISTVIGFCLVTPLMVPNDGGRQWGARYILPVIPVLTVILVWIAWEWRVLEKGRAARLLVVLLVICIGFSAYLNTYLGGVRTLRWENQTRIKPDIDFITHQKGNVVIVSFPYIAMELGYLFDDKNFFLAPDDSSLRRLLPLLKTQGIRDYTYIFDKRVPGNQPLLLKSFGLPMRPENGDFYFEHYTIR
jgi:hypothetical protein